ncbi:hypothetical protein BU16DRAFT_571450 [Lophium mytilinum]|uniref:Rhodopsin domain-containing protein n=1 Tax=Lophium mytilinum TaxID=390894 RepID=A0A6A6QZ33_9PEZI|nr:hypothetical protein BU16DRAFT_571450 [Lophium mytilinum]
MLAAVFVGLRIYTRRKLKIRLGWDDWLIVAPLLLSIALIGPSYKHVKMWHVGIHIWEVPVNEIEPNYDDWYPVVLAFNLLNIPIVPLVKASIIMLLLRVGSVLRSIRWALYIVLVFNVGASIVPWIIYIFMCPPQTGNTWKPRTFGELHCVGRHRTGEMLIWVTCANLLTDILIFPIPFLIVRRMMSARLRSRLVVIAVFTSSLAVTGIGAAKIYLSYRDRLYSLFKPDWTYPIDYCINHIENNVAIMIANVPILRGLVTRWVFNFRTKPTPMDPEAQGGWSTSDSSGFTRVARVAHESRFARALLPCMVVPQSAGSRESEYAVRVTTEFRVDRDRKRATSLDTFDDVDSEKGGALETVTSVGSLTLVDRAEMEAKIAELSPISPCVIRGEH